MSILRTTDPRLDLSPKPDADWKVSEVRYSQRNGMCIVRVFIEGTGETQNWHINEYGDFKRFDFSKAVFTEGGNVGMDVLLNRMERKYGEIRQ